MGLGKMLIAGAAGIAAGVGGTLLYQKVRPAPAGAIDAYERWRQSLRPVQIEPGSCARPAQGVFRQSVLPMRPMRRFPG